MQFQVHSTPSSLSPADVVRLPIAETDTALVAALRADRDDAAATLLTRYEPMVKRVVTRILGPDPDVADLTQEVFVTALGSLHKLKSPNLLRGWLMGIAVFTVRGRIRKRTRWRFLTFLPVQQLPETPVYSVPEETTEALQTTYRVLAELPVNERLAFSLRFFEGMELADVAAACGVSLATIKRRLRVAQARFMELAAEEPALRDWVGADS